MSRIAARFVLALAVAIATPALAILPNSTSVAGPYDCNGTTTVFPVPFRFLDNSHLEVWRKTAAGTETKLTLGTQYSVVGAGLTGGTVTLTSGSHCADGTLTVKRVVPYTQPTAFSTQGAFNPRSHENSFDRSTMLAQQLSRRIDDTNSASCEWLSLAQGPKGDSGPQGPPGATGPAGPKGDPGSGGGGGSVPSCEDGQILSYVDGELACVPGIPVCAAGEILSSEGGTLSCVPFGDPLSLNGRHVFYRTTAPADADDPAGALHQDDEWFDTSTITAGGVTSTKYTMYRWDDTLNVWVDVTPQYLIPGGMIAGQSITAAQLADGSVNAAKLVAGTIDLSLLGPDVVSAIGTSGVIGPSAITNTMIADGAISTPKLAANSVTANAIAANAIVAGKIAAGAIGATELAANSVIAGKIAVDAVTANNIAANSVTSVKIAASAVTAAEIAAGAVTANKVAANAITAGTIAAGAVTANTLAANSVTANAIAAGAVTANALAASSVTAGKIAAGSITADRLDVNALIGKTVQTLSYQETGGYPSSGAKMDSTGNAFKVAPSAFQIGEYQPNRIGWALAGGRIEIIPWGAGGNAARADFTTTKTWGVTGTSIGSYAPIGGIALWISYDVSNSQSVWRNAATVTVTNSSGASQGLSGSWPVVLEKGLGYAVIGFRNASGWSNPQWDAGGVDFTVTIPVLN